MVTNSKCRLKTPGTSLSPFVFPKHHHRTRKILASRQQWLQSIFLGSRNSNIDIIILLEDEVTMYWSSANTADVTHCFAPEELLEGTSKKRQSNFPSQYCNQACNLERPGRKGSSLFLESVMSCRRGPTFAAVPGHSDASVRTGPPQTIEAPSSKFEESKIHHLLLKGRPWWLKKDVVGNELRSAARLLSVRPSSVRCFKMDGLFPFTAPSLL